MVNNKATRHTSSKRPISKKLRLQGELKSQKLAEALTDAAEIRNLIQEAPGFLEPEDESERTLDCTQARILGSVDIGTAKKVISLKLNFGPYLLDSSRDGRHLLMGGAKGALSLIDVVTNQPLCESNVRETIRAVKILKGYDFWAAAQKKYISIYDQQGVELHVLRDTMRAFSLEYLPFHYLLTSIGEFGELSYRDISTGAVVARHKTHRGECKVMKQNPYNGVIHLGHSRGTVTLWSPNVGRPLVDMLAHKGEVTALQPFDHHFLATAGVDRQWKVWDMRTFKQLRTFEAHGPPVRCMDASQTGLICLGYGRSVDVWKGLSTERPKMAYVKHKFNDGSTVQSLIFRPHEDLLYVGHSNGVSTMIVPGAGSPNASPFGANALASKKERQETEIRRLLEKLPPDSITLDPTEFGKLRGLKLSQNSEANHSEKSTSESSDEEEGDGEGEDAKGT